MLNVLHLARASRAAVIASVATLSATTLLVPIGCGGTPPVVKTATKPVPPGWSTCPHPVFGVGCELPDDWTLNESDAASFASPKPPGDDAIVLFVRLADGDSRGPDEVLGKYLALRDVRYDSRDRDAKSPAGAKLSEGGATAVDGGDALRFWSYRMVTASGTVVVTLVLKSATAARSEGVVQRIGASLRIAQPPKPAQAKVPRDLAGRPLDAEKEPRKAPEGDDDEKPAGKENGS